MVEQLRRLAKIVKADKDLSLEFGIGADIVDSVANDLEARKLFPASLGPKEPVVIGRENNGLHEEDISVSGNPIWTKDSSGRTMYLHPFFSFFPERGTIKVGEKETKLSPGENRLLRKFVQNPNKLLTDANLIGIVWGESYGRITNRRLGNNMRMLGKKIEPDYHKPKVIIRAVERNKKRGYMLKDESRLEREPSGQREEIVAHLGFTYFPEREYMMANGLKIFFSPIENGILKLMFSNFNVPVSVSAFGYKSEASLRQRILSLRRRIQGSGISILSVRRKGYMLVVDQAPPVS